MTPKGQSTWRAGQKANGIRSGTVPVEEGGLVRYAYDRRDEQDWAKFKATREGSGSSTRIECRLLLVTPDLEEAQDTVETWNDLSV